GRIEGAGTRRARGDDRSRVRVRTRRPRRSWRHYGAGTDPARTRFDDGVVRRAHDRGNRPQGPARTLGAQRNRTSAASAAVITRYGIDHAWKRQPMPRLVITATLAALVLLR